MNAIPGFWGSLPTQARATATATREGPLATLLLCIPLLSTTLLAKLSVPPFAAQSLSISYLFIFMTMAVGLVLGYFRLNTIRTGFFLLFIACIGALQVIRGEPFSLNSLLMLTMVHLAYVFYLPRQGDNTARALDFFLGFAIIMALLGIAQYGLQFVLGPRLVFPIENFVPGDYVIAGFNMQAPISYGVNTYRANGIFFSEPSFFSQFMALAIIVELLTHNRLFRVGICMLALLLSYSGTGLMLLALCTPLILITKRHWGMLGMALAGLVLLALLGDYVNLDRLTGRVSEFDSERSSASARFISGFHLFEKYLWPDPLRALFGYGAGKFTEYALQQRFPVAEMTLFKMVFEYGLIGATSYFIFIFYCVSRSTAPSIVRLAVALTLLLSGPFVPFFHGLALSLLVWTSNAGEASPPPIPRRVYPRERSFSDAG